MSSTCAECGQKLITLRSRYNACPDGHGRLIPGGKTALRRAELADAIAALPEAVHLSPRSWFWVAAGKLYRRRQWRFIRRFAPLAHENEVCFRSEIRPGVMAWCRFVPASTRREALAEPVAPGSETKPVI